jgi:hypothetical protein
MMGLEVNQFDKCKGGQHSFEYMNYMPDFERQCYVLHFQCEFCELDIFDNIKQVSKAGR